MIIAIAINGTTVTPFNGGCSYINVFLQGHLQARSSENIAGSVAHLSTIVDDLLKTYKSINRRSLDLPPC